MIRQQVFGIGAAGFLLGGVLLLGPTALAQDGSKTAAAAGAAKQADSVSLRAKWAKGDVAKFDVVMESRRKSGVEGRDESVQSQRLLQELHVTRRVLDANEQGATLSIVYDRVQMNIFADRSILKFDSAAPAAEDAGNELAAMVRPVVGLPITVKIDAAGNVLSIEGNEEPAPKTDQDLQRASMARSLIGDEIFSRVLAPLYGLPHAPERGAPGDAWTSEEVNDRPPLGVLTLDAKHTLGSVADGAATVTTTGTVKLTRAVGNMAVKADLTGQEIKGTALWDTIAGSIRSFDSEQKIVISADDPSGSKRSIESVAKITISRATDAKPKAEASKP